ncbi:unnamed protein product [Protopolystoma xenopodis]|uniref:Uncharacterized protein n=1 Tax=Protopolystoma xenopodis TaxID=117903 RepID=A0A3S5FDT3_9PLAT|nr:unnamed protein product [Protopolystoma xenopodis]
MHVIEDRLSLPLSLSPSFLSSTLVQPTAFVLTANTLSDSKRPTSAKAALARLLATCARQYPNNNSVGNRLVLLASL